MGHFARPPWSRDLATFGVGGGVGSSAGRLRRDGEVFRAAWHSEENTGEADSSLSCQYSHHQKSNHELKQGARRTCVHGNVRKDIWVLVGSYGHAGLELARVRACLRNPLVTPDVCSGGQ